MNSKKVGAVALSAVALVVLASGCAGVRSQVEAGTGQSSITSLQQQAASQHKEAAEVRARQHAVPLDAAKVAVDDLIRAEKQAAIQASASSNRITAAAAQGARLTKQAEAYRAQVEKHALEQVAPEERRAQHPEQTTPPSDGAQDTVTDAERAAQHPQQEQR